jgi:hypothetical protein
VAFAAALLGYRARLFNGMVPIAELIGAASYSLYLTHWFTLLVWNKVCRLLGAPVLAATISFVPVALLLVYACFRAFELPVQTLMRGAAGKRSGVDPLAVTNRASPCCELSPNASAAALSIVESRPKFGAELQINSPSDFSGRKASLPPLADVRDQCLRPCSRRLPSTSPS